MSSRSDALPSSRELRSSTFSPERGEKEKSAALAEVRNPFKSYSCLPEHSFFQLRADRNVCSTQIYFHRSYIAACPEIAPDSSNKFQTITSISKRRPVLEIRTQ